MSVWNISQHASRSFVASGSWKRSTKTWLPMAIPPQLRRVSTSLRTVSLPAFPAVIFFAMSTRILASSLVGASACER